jgi:hypothetical protein
MLGHHWEKAEATIVARTVREHRAGYQPRYDFVVDVVPESGPPARLTIQDGPAGDFDAPSAGDVLRVLYDPKHQHAKWDYSDPWLADSAADRRGASAAAGFGGGGFPAGSVQYLSGAAASEMLDSLFGPDGASAIAALRSQAHGQSGPGTSDPAERLARLAALRDRGLLTEAEYAAQRQRIIGEL